VPNRTPASTHARAEAEQIVSRLIHSDDTVRSIAADYGCTTTISAIFAEHVMPEHREQVRARKIARAKTGIPTNRAPWNKGLTGIHLSPSTQFKPGELHGRARRFVPVCSITVRNDPKSGKPSRWIKVRADGPVKDRWRLYATHLWEQQNGVVSSGHRVMHADGDTMNDDLTNLVCVDGAGAFRLIEATVAAAQRRSDGLRRRKQRIRDTGRARAMAFIKQLEAA
jgi:hypothetical protein